MSQPFSVLLTTRFVHYKILNIKDFPKLNMLGNCFIQKEMENQHSNSPWGPSKSTDIQGPHTMGTERQTCSQHVRPCLFPKLLQNMSIPSVKGTAIYLPHDSPSLQLNASPKPSAGLQEETWGSLSHTSCSSQYQRLPPCPFSKPPLVEKGRLNWHFPDPLLQRKVGGEREESREDDRIKT